MEGLDRVEIGRSALAQMVGDGLQYLAVRGSERECRNSTGIDLERLRGLLWRTNTQIVNAELPHRVENSADG